MDDLAHTSELDGSPVDDRYVERTHSDGARRVAEVAGRAVG